jgi:hypothetical protein
MYLFYVFQLKEHQQKGKDPTGTKTSGRKTPKPHLEVDGSFLEQNSVFDSGPLNSECSEVQSMVNVVYIFIIAHIYEFLVGIALFCVFFFLLQNGIGRKVDSKVKTSTESSVMLQGFLDEPAAPEKNYSYHSLPNLDEINESNMKDVSTAQTGVSNEVEENAFKKYTDSIIPAVTTIPTNTPIATVSSITVTDSVPSGYVHSSDIATAMAFFDNYSPDKEIQSSNVSIDMTSDIKDSEQVTTVHQLFPASSYLHLDVAGDAQSCVFFSGKESDPSQSVTVQSSDTAASQESLQVIDSERAQTFIGNETDDVIAHVQHETQNTSVLLSAAEHSISARSSSECLRQLSLQMNGLIDESARDSVTHIEVSELECRNQELAALLEIKQQKCEQMELQLKEYVSYCNFCCHKL